MSSTPPSPPSLSLDQFTYDLPAHFIAVHPLPERDQSRMLVYRLADNSISHQHFTDLPELLPRGSLLVVNCTRVIAARINMVKPTGGAVEVLLTDPVSPIRDPAVVLASTEPSAWRCLIGGRNVFVGMVLQEPHSDLEATVTERTGTEAIVELSWSRGISLSQVLSEVGHLPLPPYIHRAADAEDNVRYQTVYAVDEGSVAAPTAGLHFTERSFNALALRDIERTEVTLHVGLGTFRPVDAVDVRDHQMHEERFGMTRAVLEKILRHVRSGVPWITAVGTTSLRTLESVFLFGAKLCRDGLASHHTADVEQWDAFDTSLQQFTREDSIDKVLAWMDSHVLHEIWGNTRLMIAPGCNIAMVDALVTNFHQPGNTLLLLVAGFCGEHEWRKIYDAALENKYRFLSYGDSSLLIRTPL
ncbi:MAG: S-adenosylmethionine:tRNA ribosyltransferase-isomerase [Candidatus Kapabacteria bacterium]|nr:S-adenosylmethionine:tRNA ribosyltransferase-isomerase [Candidatus Kapabacteria bacterium]